ncbi:MULTISPECIES: hypothetical protein [Kamptonema]|uniref:hypothetical protein n=1 Tax=Kamptonema TaxID=1501433 RepID=UPI0001DAD024|nr:MULTISPECIES: hypothetical protein [Kamptonema]CBN55755.1 hypothetical protein OSCI_2420010 [Kamptonema sp. PCC 6506]
MNRSKPCQLGVLMGLSPRQSRDLNSISNFTNFGLDGGLTGRFNINAVCDAELV